jgi:hypothetical protein
MTQFHGQGGHAISHFKRWKSTPVQPDTTREDEAAARNLANRIATELPDRSGGGDGRPDYHFSLVWYSRLAARHWIDCADFYWNFNRSLLRAAKIV